MIDPVAVRIHKALGLPPPNAKQPPPYRPDPVVQLAKLIDAAAEDWLAGRAASMNALERALVRVTPEQIAHAHELLHLGDQIRAAMAIERRTDSCN